MKCQTGIISCFPAILWALCGFVREQSEYSLVVLQFASLECTNISLRGHSSSNNKIDEFGMSIKEWHEFKEPSKIILLFYLNFLVLSIVLLI